MSNVKSGTGLGAFVGLKKSPPSTQASPLEGAAVKPAPGRKPTPAGGRKITIRNLTNEDLRRLNEFKYTHGTTIQNMAIEGLSLVLAKYGLRPLSGHVTQLPPQNGGGDEVGE